MHDAVAPPLTPLTPPKSAAPAPGTGPVPLDPRLLRALSCASDAAICMPDSLRAELMGELSRTVDPREGGRLGALAALAGLVALGGAAFYLASPSGRIGTPDATSVEQVATKRAQILAEPAASATPPAEVAATPAVDKASGGRSGPVLRLSPPESGPIAPTPRTPAMAAARAERSPKMAVVARSTSAASAPPALATGSTASTASTAVTAVTAVTAAPPSVRWSEALGLPRVADVDRRLGQALPSPIRFQSSLSDRATNCRELLTLLQRGLLFSDEQDLPAAHFQTTHCLAVALVGQARRPLRSQVRDFKLDATSLRWLPPVLAAAVDTETEAQLQAADLQGKSLAQWPQVRSARESDGALVVSGAAWEARLQVLAQGDFDGDGTEDLLVSSDERTLDNRFQNTKLYILTRSAPDERLRVLRRVH